MTKPCDTCGVEVEVRTSESEGVTWTSYSCEACGAQFVLADAGCLDLGLDSTPCVPISCPPIEEIEINWIGPTENYVPGTFAREAAEFYSEEFS